MATTFKSYIDYGDGPIGKSWRSRHIEEVKKAESNHTVDSASFFIGGRYHGKSYFVVRSGYIPTPWFLATMAGNIPVAVAPELYHVLKIINPLISYHGVTGIEIGHQPRALILNGKLK